MRLPLIAGFAAVGIILARPAFAGDISPQANREYLTANAAKPGVMVRPSGLQTPGSADIVTVAYKGALVDGYVFDQTKPGETRDLPAGKLIPGWMEALSLMKEGDEWELVVPSELGYGAATVGNGAIPPNQTLVFDMQLIAVIHPRP
jgi:FKBP-type peptidyl-prolyl cis-trans isomerase